jgi:hypothetical protein
MTVLFYGPTTRTTPRVVWSCSTAAPSLSAAYQAEVLALDDDAYRVAGSYADEASRIEYLADTDFLAEKSTRSHEEFLG